MIARDPIQRSLYEARLKAERDARAKEDYAREKGRSVGESIGKIKLLRQLLGDDPATNAEYQTLSLADLAEIEQDLQCRLRERG